MRVFISWSGDLSKELAETFRNWIPSALQYVKPYFTPADIEKGTKWATEIFKELSASSICISQRAQLILRARGDMPQGS
jgi:hypothetical protein